MLIRRPAEPTESPELRTLRDRAERGEALTAVERTTLERSREIVRTSTDDGVLRTL